MVVRDPWVEQDSHGKVKYAVIQTVRQEGRSTQQTHTKVEMSV